MTGSLFCCICHYRPVFPPFHSYISSFLLAAIQFSVCTCTGFCWVFNKGQVVAVSLAWLPVVCDKLNLQDLLRRHLHSKLSLCPRADWIQVAIKKQCERHKREKINCGRHKLINFFLENSNTLTEDERSENTGKQGNIALLLVLITTQWRLCSQAYCISCSF